MIKRTILRQLLVTTTAACLLLGFTGCSTKRVKLDPKNPTVISLWHYYNEPLKGAFDRMVNQFNDTYGAETGIFVDAYSMGSVGEMLQKVEDAANGKAGTEALPDIFSAYADTAYAVDQKEMLADLSDYFSKEEQSTYVKHYLEEGRFGNTLKILPVAKSTEVMMMNKTDWDKFSSATGADIGKLSTVEGVTEVAADYYRWTDSLTPEPDDGRAFFGRDAIANYMIIGCRQLQQDIFLEGEDSVTLQFTEDAARKLWNHYYVPMIYGHFGAYGKFRSDDAKTGDIVAMVASTSGTDYFPKQVSLSDTENYPIELMVLPPPVFEGAKNVAVQQGAGMVVTKSDPARTYAAVEFLKWFTRTENSLDFSIASGYLPVTNDANRIQAVEQSVERVKAAGMEISSAMTQMLPVALQVVQEFELYTPPPLEQGNEIRNLVGDSLPNLLKTDLEAIEKLRANGMTRAEAAATFDTDTHFKEWYDSLSQALDAYK